MQLTVRPEFFSLPASGYSHETLENNTKETSLKDAAKISEAFLDEHLDTEVADEALLVRLALAWNSEVARRYPEI